MQFGRFCGLALVVLGIILCGLQVVLVVAPKMNRQASEVTSNAEHRSNPLPGIVGAGSLVAGIAMRRAVASRDEPEPKHAVK